MMVQDTEAGELLSSNVLKGDLCGSVENHEYCFNTGKLRFLWLFSYNSILTLANKIIVKTLFHRLGNCFKV